MRRYLILLFFALIVCLTQTSEARKFALLVGVDDYEKFQPLNCCVNDMKALKEALIKIGFEKDDIHMLYTGGSVRFMPTKRKIEEEVAKILDAVKSEDVVFFAFSGHGMREGTVDYFCPTFADLDNLEKTSVSITKVMNDLSQCRAKFKWMVIDACRSNNVKGVKGFQVISYPPKGIVLFQSCSEGESSYEEDRKGGNGYFTKNLVAALSGQADSDRDGKLTLLEVCKWTAAQTRVEVEKVENKTQRPFLNLESSDFILTEDLNISKAKALVEEARNAMEAENYALAVKKFDEAIALCPGIESIKRYRKYAQKLLDAENRVQEVEKRANEERQRKANALAAEARNAMEDGNYALAVEKYDEALALNPDYVPWKQDRNLAQQLLSSEKNRKIHVLFVWGTNEVSMSESVKAARDDFERKMESIGICKGSEYIASFTSLSGDDAHPDKILEHCKKMAQEAGENDALFVYICCPGNSYKEGNSQKRIIKLLPDIKSLSDMVEKKDKSSIKRSSILKAMKSSKHRLDVLITDCSSNLIEEDTKILRKVGFTDIDLNINTCSWEEDSSQNRQTAIVQKNSCLMYLLLNAQGTINWNSSDPYGGKDAMGELSFAIKNDKYNGSLFAQAFTNVACTTLSSNEKYTKEDFFNKVGAELDKNFSTKIGEITICMTGQDQQTLTEFDDDDNVRKTWSK